MLDYQAIPVECEVSCRKVPLGSLFILLDTSSEPFHLIDIASGCFEICLKAGNTTKEPCIHSQTMILKREQTIRHPILQRGTALLVLCVQKMTQSG